MENRNVKLLLKTNITKDDKPPYLLQSTGRSQKIVSLSAELGGVISELLI